MANPLFIKTYRATSAVGGRLIVKPGTNDFDVIPAAAATDKLIGVSTEVDAASGDPCDVIHTGTAPVKLGGTVAAGDYITSDGAAKGVKCNPSTGTTAQYVGKAIQAGVSGDIIDVLLGNGQLTTP